MISSRRGGGRIISAFVRGDKLSVFRKEKLAYYRILWSRDLGKVIKYHLMVTRHDECMGNFKPGDWQFLMSKSSWLIYLVRSSRAKIICLPEIISYFMSGSRVGC